MIIIFFFFKQKTAYELRISDWSSDVCSSDLDDPDLPRRAHQLVHPPLARAVLVHRRRPGQGRLRHSLHGARGAVSRDRPAAAVDLGGDVARADRWTVGDRKSGG